MFISHARQKRLLICLLREIRGALYFSLCIVPLIFGAVLLAAHVEGKLPVNPPSAVTWLFGSLAALIAVVLAGWLDGPYGAWGGAVLRVLLLLTALSLLPAASRNPGAVVSQVTRWRGRRIRVEVLVIEATEQRRSYSFAEAIEGYEDGFRRKS